MTIIRSFAKYRIHSDPATEIPSSRLLPIERRRFSPHIYSRENIEHILQDSRKFTGKLAFAYVSQWAILGLIAVTGLRSGEACRLLLGDVDLKRNLIRVRDGKGMRERIVPIHSSTSRMLTSYLRRRRQVELAAPEKPFFCNTRGNAMHPNEVLRKFRCTLKRLNIVNRAGSLPRVHDLRHTFATNSVARFHQMGSSRFVVGEGLKG